MPELPEVETVRRGLQPSLEGARLTRVVQRRPDLRFPLPERFAERLTGAKVLGLHRRAKYLLAELDTGETWITHLGMTGRFTVGAVTPGAFAHAAPADEKHEHLVFETGAGARIGYADARRFGYMGLIPTAALEDDPWFRGLGPEPLGNAFSAAWLAEAFAGKSQNVKVTLLDQRVVAGLGNIYVCEALHRSRVSPLTPAGKISRERLERLAVAVREVLAEAIEAGGSTLRDFANVEGDLGYFQHRFRAYGREGEPCVTEGCRGVVRRIVQAGRSTFYCPVCQR
ncbi:bifunctional DNA-formamidopyrimidine glycosylase/DNA-(apurinic or apyrimidinic site) lyase [Caulobacter sp. 17J80-11]|uniref:bifunctional DNA-formamidopyrimidine glycosylase/DNA-(apurinic or apyrimidinic site) lyase n=1 Tax=Caulobacter sp. 17J80-11 TaxID=2763502 RepID=UPI0016536C35|nr:bifunctional DNA-formamidopyrimidine glycosylase/DNA-(apurinic or apyrimidinic site) lyase [Caulobacter sp. 17J80-11]MBC6981477.1 bifunctional DNA-formamidopyrimidine glycosylase/DNA-(apurinic or apyrimidinic site) lyase [Caulobacter sp. 17J80-11]